jgi:hypothetical protein
MASLPYPFPRPRATRRRGRAAKRRPDPRQPTFPWLPPPCAHGGGFALRWSRWRDGTNHLASFCLGCGAWLRWVAATADALAAAPPQPER